MHVLLSRLSRLSRLAVLGSLCACATSSISSVPAAPRQLDVDRGIVNAPAHRRWCDQEAAPVEATAPLDIANAVNALAALDPASLKKRIRADVQARVERAGILHDADAELHAAQPLDPMHGAEMEVAALLAEGRACHAALVIGEMRIDFPPPFHDTRDENAQEIDAVHELIYAGTSVTAYCGPCAIYALVLAPRPDSPAAFDILAWDPLVGGDPMTH